jgi:hypothetical protein
MCSPESERFYIEAETPELGWYWPQQAISRIKGFMPIEQSDV